MGFVRECSSMQARGDSNRTALALQGDDRSGEKHDRQPATQNFCRAKPNQATKPSQAKPAASSTRGASLDPDQPQHSYRQTSHLRSPRAHFLGHPGAYNRARKHLDAQGVHANSRARAQPALDERHPNLSYRLRVARRHVVRARSRAHRKTRSLEGGGEREGGRRGGLLPSRMEPRGVEPLTSTMPS